MKESKLNSRSEKIKFLQQLKEGKATIQELMPLKVELWKQYLDEPHTYINESTGEEITAHQMQEKQSNKKDNVLFVTVLHRKRYEK